jgi:putative intracellular protease/amidase
MFGTLMGAKVDIVAKTLEPVHSDLGPAIVPTMTLTDCPAEVTLVMVPGGTRGTVAAMQDAEILAFLRDRSRHAVPTSS